MSLAIVPAAIARLRTQRITADEWTIPLLVSLAIMSFAGIYFMETERIWIYAMPWVAGAAVAHASLDPTSVRRIVVAGVLQTLVMEALFFTLW